MKTILIKTDRDECWHLESNFNDMTLCGLDAVGDDSPYSFIEVIDRKYNGKIDCPDCIKIIEYCKRVRKERYKKRKW